MITTTCIASASSVLRPELVAASLFGVLIIVGVCFGCLLKRLGKLAHRLDDLEASAQRIRELYADLAKLEQKSAFIPICTDAVTVQSLASAPYGIVSIYADNPTPATCAALAARLFEVVQGDGLLVFVDDVHFAWLLPGHDGDKLQLRSRQVRDALCNSPVPVLVGAQQAPLDRLPRPDVLADTLTAAHFRGIADSGAPSLAESERAGGQP